MFTSVYGLLDPPAVSVVAAVPQLVPELILALHQALPGPEGDGLHGLRQPRAEADLLGREAGQGETDVRETCLASRLVGLQAHLGQGVGGAAQESDGPAGGGDQVRLAGKYQQYVLVARKADGMSVKLAKYPIIWPHCVLF